MRVIGVDLGQRWIGIAWSDESGRIAVPLEVIQGVDAAIRRLEALIAGGEVDRVVLGLPRNMDGSMGPKAREALQFVEVLRGRLPVPIESWDERLTTVEAEHYLRDAAVPRRRWKERVNQMAAQILLQSYLDARVSKETDDAADGNDGGEDPADGGDDP